MKPLRIFNDVQLQAYKDSKLCVEQYKNKSLQDLENLQHSDEQLQQELIFNQMLRRVNTFHQRYHKYYDNHKQEVQGKQKSFLEKLHSKKKSQLKKKQSSVETTITYTVTPVQVQQSTNYRKLFEDKINEEEWKPHELVIRNMYIEEYQKLSQSGGCTGCKKNALIRKYMTKLNNANTPSS